jgi:hypothetical protein
LPSAEVRRCCSSTAAALAVAPIWEIRSATVPPGMRVTCPGQNGSRGPPRCHPAARWLARAPPRHPFFAPIKNGLAGASPRARTFFPGWEVPRASRNQKLNPRISIHGFQSADFADFRRLSIPRQSRGLITTNHQSRITNHHFFRIDVAALSRCRAPQLRRLQPLPN